MFDDIAERVQGKLEGWKMKFLSFAGRRTLVKSMLSVILMYLMQTTLIPIDVCNKIKSLIRRFLWGGCHKEKTCHLVNWGDLSQSKSSRGLDF